jgi:hypothetical protein
VSFTLSAVEEAGGSSVVIRFPENEDCDERMGEEDQNV